MRGCYALARPSVGQWSACHPQTLLCIFAGVLAPRSIFALTLPLVYASGAAAQTETIRYDAIDQNADAAVVCGFCATEKFGSIFYDLNGTGLQSSMFPLQLDAIELAVASTRVTGSPLGGYTCEGVSTGGTVNANMEIFAGSLVPVQIETLPVLSPWPGEILVGSAQNIQLNLSVDTSPPNGLYNVMLNTIPVAQSIPAGYSYIRVVVSIPVGSSSQSCTDLGFSSPAFSPIRDNDGTVGRRRGFIYQLGVQIPELMIDIPPQWTWLEEVQDIFNPGGAPGITGDWLLRIQVTPSSAPADAGVGVDVGPPPDGGAHADAGPTPDGGLGADAGATAADVGASSGDAPTITSISPDQGPSDADTDVVVVGQDFQPGLGLRIGAIAADVRSISGTTTINATVPRGIAAGRYDVVVTNPDGQSAILKDGFTVGGSGGLSESSGCVCVSANGAKAARQTPWWAAAAFAFLGWGVIRRRRQTSFRSRQLRLRPSRRPVRRSGGRR